MKRDDDQYGSIPRGDRGQTLQLRAAYELLESGQIDDCFQVVRGIGALTSQSADNMHDVIEAKLFEACLLEDVGQTLEAGRLLQDTFDEVVHLENACVGNPDHCYASEMHTTIFLLFNNYTVNLRHDRALVSARELLTHYSWNGVSLDDYAHAIVDRSFLQSLLWDVGRAYQRSGHGEIDQRTVSRYLRSSGLPNESFARNSRYSRLAVVGERVAVRRANYFAKKDLVLAIRDRSSVERAALLEALEESLRDWLRIAEHSQFARSEEIFLSREILMCSLYTGHFERLLRDSENLFDNITQFLTGAVNSLQSTTFNYRHVQIAHWLAEVAAHLMLHDYSNDSYRRLAWAIANKSSAIAMSIIGAFDEGSPVDQFSALTAYRVYEMAFHANVSMARVSEAEKAILASEFVLERILDVDVGNPKANSEIGRIRQLRSGTQNLLGNDEVHEIGVRLLSWSWALYEFPDNYLRA